ncbi:MAG: acyl-CoA dehydrogenase family protein [Pseudomonadota bacterium]
MSQLPPRETLNTHEVINQPVLKYESDLWLSDPALQTHAGAAGADAEVLGAYGEQMGAAGMRAAGQDANRHLPELRAFDEAGRRLDEVIYASGYHALMKAGIAAGYTAMAWEGAAGGHASHAAMVYLSTQIAPGICGPLSMTYAGIPALEASDDLFASWVPKLVSRAYDQAVRPVSQKSGAMLALPMTEKQSGSDLSSISTRAVRDGAAYRLRGHKYYCSAPMSDGFLTLAQTSAGLTAFLVPRWLEDRRNGIELLRLKNKLGNRANATAEIEFSDALAHRLGHEGAGLATVAVTVQYTRLDAALAAPGLMRAALVQATQWSAQRRVRDQILIDQPLMRQVLADLALDWEGALALGLYAARFFDATAEPDRAFARLAVALAKYLNTRLCPGVVCEAMEVMGGAGYIEDSGLPPLYREAPLNAIYDGSGNMLCLDVLKMLREMPQAGDVLSAELGAAAGQIGAYDTALSDHITRFPRLADEAQARWFTESLATLLTASVLIRYAPEDVAAGYAMTRLGQPRGRTMGAIPQVDTSAILSRLGVR